MSSSVWFRPNDKPRCVVHNSHMPQSKPAFDSGLELFLREWRRHRRFTQEKLVELSGIDKATISQLENRKVPINERHLISLARALDCRPIDLLTWNPLLTDRPLSEIVKGVPPHQQNLARRMLLALIGDKPEAAAKAAREDAA